MNSTPDLSLNQSLTNPDTYEMRREAQSTRPKDATTGERLRIAIVDDSEVDLYLVERLLNEVATLDAELIKFLAPKEAIKSLANTTVDLILADFHMGSLTGLDFLWELRGRGQSAPVILMTGVSDMNLAAEAIHAGVDDFLPKDSLSASSLKRAITNVVERSRKQREVIAAQEELKSNLESLRDRNRELASFHHKVSHELKAPLAGANELVLFVLEELVGPISDMQKEFLETAHGKNLKVLSSLDDMLDSTREEAGLIACKPKLHDADASLGDVREA